MATLANSERIQEFEAYLKQRVSDYSMAKHYVSELGRFLQH